MHVAVDEPDDVELKARLFDQAVGLLAVAGFDGYFRVVNHSWSDVLGWSTDELVARPYRELFHPDEVERNLKEIEQLAAGHRLVDHDLRFRCADGTFRWVRSCAQPDVDAGLFYLSIVDIGPQRESELARQEAEERFRQAFEHAPSGIGMADLNGVLLRVNPTLCSLLGYGADDDLLGLDVSRLAHPDDRPEVLRTYVSLLEGDAEVCTAVQRYRHRDGRYVWVHVNTSLISDAANFRYFLLHVIDVTDLHEVEEELRSRVALENAVGTISNRLVDIEGEQLDDAIATALAELGGLFGIDAVAVLDPGEQGHGGIKITGKWQRRPESAPVELLKTADPELATWWRAWVKRGTALHAPVVAELPDGARPLQVYLDQAAVQSFLAVPLLRAGRASGVVAMWSVARPVDWPDYAVGLIRVAGESISNALERVRTHRALAETAAELEQRNIELERSNRELEEFAYSASHDLKSPLHAVQGFLHLLDRLPSDKLGPDGRRFIEVALESTERMATLIDDLLTYAQAGRAVSEPTPVDLAALFSQVVTDSAPAIEAAGASVLAEPLPVVEGDKTQLGQLLQNLLENALKFTVPGRVPRVQVSAERRGAEWQIAVDDNGIGVAPADRDRIFTMLTRLHTRDRYPGSGIGLALCLKVAGNHGGRIWVTDSPFGGSRFCVTLPAVAPGR